jgi:hypothetical protein
LVETSDPPIGFSVVTTRPFEQASSVYLAEIIYQTQIVDDAIGRLVAALEPDRQRAAVRDSAIRHQTQIDIGSAIQVTLGAAALVSKMLTPVGSSSEWAKDRGRKLCVMLSVDGASVLRSRDVRDSLEHFDERLDVFAQEPFNPFVARHWMVMSDSPLGNESNMPILRYIDPNKLIVRMPGRKPKTDADPHDAVRLNLLDLQTELHRLRDAAITLTSASAN